MMIKSGYMSANCCSSTNLGLEDLVCRNDQYKKSTCVMHSEIICLFHRHVADCQ